MLFSLAHKHKHKKNEHVCFSCAYAYAYAQVRTASIRQMSGFVLPMFVLVSRVFSLAYDYACTYACAYAYALVRTSLKGTRMAKDGED